MTARRAVLFAGLLALLAALPCRADRTLEAELAAIDARAARVRDLVADFTQRKHTALLRRPLESSGTLRIRGEVMRWDTKAPRRSVMWIDGTTMKLFFPDRSLLEVYPLESGVAGAAVSPLPRLDAARRRFTITRAAWPVPTDGLALHLVPRGAELAEHVESVRLLLDRDTGTVAAAVVEYPDHERLELTFERVRVNTGLTEADVALDVPAGTRITHPAGNPAP